MTRNAMWWVNYEFTLPGGTVCSDMLSLSSPDLADARKARARAKETALTRLRKKMAKGWPLAKDMKLRVTGVRCVG